MPAGNLFTFSLMIGREDAARENIELSTNNITMIFRSIDLAILTGKMSIMQRNMIGLQMEKKESSECFVKIGNGDE